MNRILTISLIFVALSLFAKGQSRKIDYYLEEGIKNSPLLKDYYNQTQTALLDSLIIRVSKKPLLEANSQAIYDPVFRNFGYDEVVTDGGNYQAVVSVSQNILNRRDITNRFESVDIRKRATSNLARITIAELKKLITGQYLNCCSAFSDLAFNKSFLEIYRNENIITRQFVTNGILKQTDYLSLQIETQSQEILVKTAEKPV